MSNFFVKTQNNINVSFVAHSWKTLTVSATPSEPLETYPIGILDQAKAEELRDWLIEQYPLPSSLQEE